MDIPRKSGLYWFIPALANKRVGSSWGTQGEDGQKVCWCFSAKNWINVDRTLSIGHSSSESLMDSFETFSSTAEVSSVLIVKEDWCLQWFTRKEFDMRWDRPPICVRNLETLTGYCCWREKIRTSSYSAYEVYVRLNKILWHGCFRIGWRKP